MTVIRLHLDEIVRVNECFLQFRAVINCEFVDNIDRFVRRTEHPAEKLDQFRSYLDQCRHYQHLARQLPERIAFPMFEIGTRQVKNML